MAVVFASASHLLAEGPAGTILFCMKDSEPWLLLADHAGWSQRGWASFGGGAQDGETPAETAARETEEETKGYFKRQDLLQRIANSTPIADGVYHFFFVEVEYVPIEEIRNHRQPSLNLAFYERSPFAWIPFSEVEKCLRPGTPGERCHIDARYLPPDAVRTWFWDTWLNNLRAAASQNRIPWATQAGLE